MAAPAQQPLRALEAAWRESWEGSPDEALATSWREAWAGSQSQFCRRYQLNQGNFSRWLQGKKMYLAAAREVERFLVGGPGPKVGPGPPEPADPIIRAPADESRARAVVADEERIAAFRAEAKSMRQLLEILAPKIAGLREVVFLDGDQYVHPIRHFTLRPDQHEHYHFVVCVAPTCCPRALMESFGRSWLTVLLAASAHRDASDCDLTVAATASNQRFGDCPTPFVLVSGDHFVHGLKARLDELALRSCSVLTPQGYVRRMDRHFGRVGF